MLLKIKNYFFKLWFKKMSCAAFSGLSRLRCSVIVLPAFENIRSHGTEVAVLHSLRSIRVKRRGYMCFLSCHHFNGFSVLFSNGSFKYLSVSIMAAADELLTSRCCLTFSSKESQIKDELQGWGWSVIFEEIYGSNCG